MKVVIKIERFQMRRNETKEKEEKNEKIETYIELQPNIIDETFEEENTNQMFKIFI